MEKKRRGRPSTGFDKKAYDAERMRRIRAGTWEPRPPQPNKYIPHIGAKQKAKKASPTGAPNA